MKIRLVVAFEQVAEFETDMPEARAGHICRAITSMFIVLGWNVMVLTENQDRPARNRDRNLD